MQRVCCSDLCFFDVERATFGECVGRVAWSFTRRSRHLAPLAAPPASARDQLGVFLAAGGCFMKPRAACLSVQWAGYYEGGSMPRWIGAVISHSRPSSADEIVPWLRGEQSGQETRLTSFKLWRLVRFSRLARSLFSPPIRPSTRELRRTPVPGLFTRCI